MGLVRFWAVGIDDLRDLFTASPHLTARLRERAGAAWPTPALVPRGNRLDRLGPFSRRAAGAPVIRPGVPTGRDVEDLVHGRDIDPGRLSAAWALVELWLDDACRDHLEFDITPAAMDDLDFALACAGVDVRYSLRKLFNDALAIPLKPDAGRASGYVRAGHARAMGRAWRAALPGLADRHRAVAQPVGTWLSCYENGGGGEGTFTHPAPDLVAIYRPVSPEPDR